MNNNNNTVYIVYGVSGSGKTTIGKLLSEKLDIPFYDADDFHPKTNIDKMVSGMALNDADRNPWLSELALAIKNWHYSKGSVLACSALKVNYRNLLESSVDSKYIQWIFLKGSYEVIANRLKNRKQHFFDTSLLTSQFETLEEPTTGVIIDIDNEADTLIHQILEKIEQQ